jgi:hypothetical protein
MFTKIFSLGIITTALFSSDLNAQPLPCLSGIDPSTELVCHNENGFNFGCYLTRAEVTTLRSVIDSNFNKKSAIVITDANQSKLFVSVQWNGNYSDYVFNREDFTYRPK